MSNNTTTYPARLRPNEVKDRLKVASDKLILLDVRTPQEWRADGYIDGAVLIPTYEVLQRAPAELPKDAPIIVYCAHGNRSAQVAAYFSQEGYSNIIDMAGGLALWGRAGLPVSRD